MKHSTPEQMLGGAFDLSGDVSAIEMKSTGEAPEQIVGKALENLQKSFDDRLQAFTDAQAQADKRFERLEMKMNRPVAGFDAAEPSIEKKAFDALFRGGLSAVDEADRKALNWGTPGAGGYVTAPEYSSTVIEGIAEHSPMRSLAATMTIGTAKVYLPKLVGHLNGGWVTETGTRPESQPAFDQDQIEVFEHAVIVPMSRQLVEDAIIDIPAYVADQIARRFAREEGLAFTTGNGNGKPTGFLHDPNIYQAVEAKQDGSDLIAKLIELFYDLESEYAMAAKWQMNRRTMGLIRAAADNTAKGTTLWSDGLANGTPPHFLGRPVVENRFMPDLVHADEEDSFPVALGDWSRAYQIVDHAGANGSVEVMSDPYTGADNGVWKLRARRRLGGKAVLPEAVMLLKGIAA